MVIDSNDSGTFGPVAIMIVVKAEINASGVVVVVVKIIDVTVKYITRTITKIIIPLAEILECHWSITA